MGNGKAEKEVGEIVAAVAGWLVFIMVGMEVESWVGRGLLAEMLDVLPGAS
jgi:hypothetical protein